MPIVLLGVFFIGLGICFAVAINFVELPPCERVDKLTSVCR